VSESTNNRLILVLGCLIVIGLAGLVYQYQAISALEQRVADGEAALASVTREAAAARERAENQAARIELLENAPDPVTGIISIPALDMLLALEPGFYELTTDTQYDPESDEAVEYAISHVVVEFNYDTYSTRLNVGIARSGTWSLPIGIYFDYNGDGKIDSDMAMKFAGDIPLIGGLLKSAYKPVISQNLYSIFVRESSTAEHVSFADISEDAGAASNRLWSFLQSQYETIKEWIFENVPQPDADS
jgi:hypothetical protein